MQIAKVRNVSILEETAGKIAMVITIIQFVTVNICFSQNREKVSYVRLDSLMKEPTFQKIVAKSKNRDKICLYNINLDDPNLGKIFILFSLFPDAERKNSFWKEISKGEVENYNQIGVNELENIIKMKISNYSKSKEDYLLDFYIENIAIVKNINEKSKISSNLYVQFFTNNSKKDSLNFKYHNYINFNIFDESTTYSNRSFKKTNTTLPHILSSSTVRKLYLFDKFSNDTYLFYRDIFNFIDYTITPKIIKGEVLKVDESFFLFKPNIGIIGRSIKKRGCKGDIFYHPVRLNVGK